MTTRFTRLTATWTDEHIVRRNSGLPWGRSEGWPPFAAEFSCLVSPPRGRMTRQGEKSYGYVFLDCRLVSPFVSLKDGCVSIR